MKFKHILVSCWEEHMGAPGMRLFNFDDKTGEINFVGVFNEKLSCNCTVYDKENNIVYLTNEIHNNPDYPKGGGGLLYAFKYDSHKENFIQISRVESSCPCPAYISIDNSKKYLLCANHSSFNAITRAVKGNDGYWHTEVLYDDAIVSLSKLNEDHSIGQMIDCKKHDKYKVNGRGLHAHPHTIASTPDGKLFICCDKGDSHIYFYKINYLTSQLELVNEPYEDSFGASPRYVKFHPYKKYMFVNHERDMHLTAYKYDDLGNLEIINNAYALENYSGQSTKTIRELLHNEIVEEPKDKIWPLEQQGLAISNDGKYLYDAINGADAISVFKINDDGSVELIQVMPINGRWVRGVTISEDNHFLAICCLQAGGLFIYEIGSDGKLKKEVSHIDFIGGSYITFLE